MNLQAVVNEMKLIFKKDLPSEAEKREVVMYYIAFCTQIMVPEVKTATIVDYVTFEKNYNIAKSYFQSFTD